MNIHYNRFRRLCAVLIGFVFVLSGTFKLIDPIGTALKVSEYWSFFHMNFMKWSSLPVGVILSLTETAAGLMLVTGIWRKFTAILTSGMIIFFTILTAVLAVVDPEMDCGCFGEVIHLSNLQTLLKNLVLLVMGCVAFIPFREYGDTKARKYVSFAVCMCASVALLIHCQLRLPLNDYTDFRPGSQLAAAHTEAESQIFEASFIYEKDGVEKVFTLDQDLPDTTWHFVRSETTGVANESARLAISDWETGECLDSLAASGNVLIISYYRPTGEKVRAHEMLQHAEALGFRPLCLSLDRENHDDFCYASDRRSILGLNRSNGGLTLVQDGYIVRKWSHRGYPSDEELLEIADGEPLETVSDSQSRSNMLQQSYLLFLFTVLLLL